MCFNSPGGEFALLSLNGTFQLSFIGEPMSLVPLDEWIRLAPKNYAYVPVFPPLSVQI